MEFLAQKVLQVFALFHFESEAILQVQAPGWGLYLEGEFNEGFFFSVIASRGLYLEGLKHGGAYSSNFTVLVYLMDEVSLTLPSTYVGKKILLRSKVRSAGIFVH